MIKKSALQKLKLARQLSDALLKNGELKKGVKFTKEEINGDVNLFVEFLELCLNDNIEKAYPLIKDVEIIIDKHSLDLVEDFKDFKQFLIKQYKKSKN